MNKTVSFVTLLTIIISGFTLAGSVHFGVAQSSTPVNGIINSDATWTPSGSPYVLTGNMLVYHGVTLTIQPGVTVNLGSYYIQVNGTLTAKGTTDNIIHFNSGSITFNPYSTSWNEQTNSGCIIENTALSSTAISSSNSVKINNNTINTGLTVDSSTLISNNTIKGNVNGGVVSSNIIKGDVNSDSILDNTIYGTVTASGIASNNTIKGGIIAFGNCNITGNIITGGLSSSGNNNGDGIYVGSNYVYGGGYSLIQNNLISNTTAGIDIRILIRMWFSANIPQIQNNMIINNSVGVKYNIVTQESYGDRKPTIIQNNTISQNAIGIELEGLFEQCIIQNNNIEENSNNSLYLEGVPNDVNATYNWWGTTDTQTINQTIYDFKNDFNVGTVNFAPFLTAPNPQAVPDPNATIQNPTPTPSPTYTPTPTPTSSPTSTPIHSPTPTQSPTAQPSLSPSPSIPEFPAWIVLPSFLVATLLAAVFVKKKTTKK